MLIAVLIGVTAVGLRFWGWRTSLSETPDTRIYTVMARGIPAPNPYRLRWLLPRLLPGKGWTWPIVSAVAFIGACPLMYAYTGSLWAVALWVALPMWGVILRLVRTPDAVAWFMALLSVVLMLHGWTIPALIAVCIAGMVAPKAPVFAALWTLNPLLLAGLIPVGIGYLTLPRGEITLNGTDIPNQWLMAMNVHGPNIHSLKRYLLPWGPLLAAGLCMDWRILPAVVVAYGQMVRATDNVRLYMWSAPVVIGAALRILPPAVLPLAVLWLWFNPIERSENEVEPAK